METTLQLVRLKEIMEDVHRIVHIEVQLVVVEQVVKEQINQELLLELQVVQVLS